MNKSLYFNVADGLDQDVMHDQLEGVLPLEIKMLLKSFIQDDKLMTLQTVNERIDKFDYGDVDIKNKPSPLKEHQVLSHDLAKVGQIGTV